MYKLIIVFFLCSISVQAKVVNSKSNNDQKTYYWFYVKVAKSHNKSTGISRMSIKSIGTGIVSGSIGEYTSAHKKGLKSDKVIIGPFTQHNQAEQAQILYRIAAKGGNAPKSNLSEEEEEPIYTFYYIKPVFFSGEMSLQPIPSRVSEGTEQEYMDMLKEGLNFEKLAVGPFIKYQAAEKSKYACLRSSNIETDHEADSIKDRNLRLMARKWKGLDRRITKMSRSKLEQRLSYRFSMKIPRLYFTPDAVQVVTIRASFDDSNSFSQSFTLQGDNVIDNNRVASYDMGTVYIIVLDYKVEGKEKIESFVFESFIYDDNQIIELDPVLVEVN